MSFEVNRLKASDLDEIVSFLNNVFSEHNGTEMRFEKKFPRIFKSIDENMSWHYAVKDNGKICGAAASYPLEYYVGDEVLKISAGGNVAVSSDYRNQGIMQIVMNKIAEDLPKENFDIAYLHGDRVRYRTFGFERCGVEYSFSFIKPKQTPNEYSFSDLRNEPKETVDIISEIAKNQLSGLNRKSEEYIDSLTAQMRTPYIIKDSEKSIVGFMSANTEESHIAEIGLTDYSIFKDIISDFMHFAQLKRAVMGVPAYEYKIVKEAIDFADRYQIIQPGNFRVINFEKTVRAFMKAKGKYSPLANGSMVIDSEIFGIWEFSNSNGKTSVNKTEKDADITLEGYSAYPFIFGTSQPVNLDAEENIKLLAANWFPLPLYCPYLT
ncbi:MAG: GNAT family N-acetyltransferase [Monoglobales bacterium]